MLINRKFRIFVLDIRVIRLVDIVSDYYLVCIKLRLKLKVVFKRRGIRRTRYDI